MKKIAVITVARSDYSILKPVLSEIEQSQNLSLSLIVGGMHLSSSYGFTVNAIIEDEFQISEKVEMLLSSDSSIGIAKSIGIGVIGFSQAYEHVQPDIILLMGDRFEMYAAAIAALPFNIPMAHIHGGELTYGAFDDAIRHSITKLSHLHFVSTEEYRRRIIQLGENSWRITVSGAPALDNLTSLSLLSPFELSKKYNLLLDESTLVVTFHPTTLELENTEKDTLALFDALRKTNKTIIFTYPNADTNGKKIIDLINKFVMDYKKSQVISSMGVQGYYSLLNCAELMVGNSSSGIIEAASFGLPVVNVGNRQEGRVCSGNVIHVSTDADDIFKGIQKGSSLEFKESLKGMNNVYDKGNASKIIVNKLIETTLNHELIYKKFQDVNFNVDQY